MNSPSHPQQQPVAGSDHLTVRIGRSRLEARCAIAPRSGYCLVVWTGRARGDAVLQSRRSKPPARPSADPRRGHLATPSVYSSGTTGHPERNPPLHHQRRRRMCCRRSARPSQSTQRTHRGEADLPRPRPALSHGAVGGGRRLRSFSMGRRRHMERFDPEEAALKAIETHRVSFRQFVPTKAFLAHVETSSRGPTALRPLLSSDASA